MEQRETIISYIYCLQRANFEILMNLMNNIWTKSAIQGEPLNESNVLELVKRIKKNGLEMLKCSQKVENFVEWTAVKSKKRKQNEDALFPKKIKRDDEQF